MEKRKYQCFICSSIFDEFSKFKTHIIETHEEGREYILCPLERCQAPVRDLRSHYKNKHPFDKVPKVQQMRASVFYDVKNPKKRRKVSHFKEGYHTSPKNHGEQAHFRSSFEYDIYLCLDIMNEVLSYQVEPFGVPYYFKGRPRTYFPDIKVIFADGHAEIWEIKPANQCIYDQNQAKWAACRAYCAVRGWKFSVYTENDIKELKNKLNENSH